MKMKNMSVIFILAILTITGCKDKIIQERNFMANVPVYMSEEAFENAIQSMPAQPLSNPGKIFYKDQYLFINDRLNGIHIVDNSNPDAPSNIAYISIPGNRDLVVKGNTLYADSYTDLVTIDVSDPTNVQQIDRIEDVFMESFPAFENNYPVYGLKDTNAVVVAWAVHNVQERTELSSTYDYGRQCIDCNWFLEDGVGIQADGPLTTTFAESSTESNGGRNASTGIAGSMSRFTCSANYLYVIDQWNLKTVDMNNFSVVNELATWRNMETLFPYEGNLFIGTTTGMLIYGLDNPAIPVEISSFNHMTSCDPVAVSGDYAYVTLRSGNACAGFTNQLDVVNISDIFNPYLEKTYSMENPHGLGIDNNTLFLCDGDAGLKVYDIQNVHEIDQNQLQHFNDINGFDVIPTQGNLMLIGSDGLYQYDYSDLSQMSLRSTIPVN
ncbi:MAG: hypothetical protein MRY83_25180 [Flavobacteriales bacterium]|nr:hypothetical protein [Flavobacteriales bacterium]